MGNRLTDTLQRRAIPVVKLEAVGNDFLLVEEQFAQEAGNWSDFAIRICNRPFGIGSDGLLVTGKSGKAAFRMRMFNPDGTEDFCGNGLRCAARYAFEKGYVSETRFEIEALGGAVIPAEIPSKETGARLVTITLPPPKFHPSEIPALSGADELTAYPLTLEGRTWEINAVNTGTTHTVIFVDTLPDDEVFLKHSPQIEYHSLFPERTSIMWCVVESRDRLKVRIWERGVGETFGCGTGASAVTVAARRAGKIEEEASIVSKGGMLQVRWSPGRSIRLSGPVNVQMEATYFWTE